MKGLVARELTTAFPEPHISHCELLCARGPHEVTIAALEITGCSVLPVAQEIIKMNKNYIDRSFMYDDFDRTPLGQQSFGTLIGSASCGIGEGLSRRSPSISV